MKAPVTSSKIKVSVTTLRNGSIAVLTRMCKQQFLYIMLTVTLTHM